MRSLLKLRNCILGALALALAGGAQAQSLRDVSIGLSSASLGTAGLRLAKELGIFAKHGLNPRFVILDSASATMTALISKSLDIAIAGPSELVAAQGHGQKVVAIGTTYGGFGPSLVLAKATAEKLGISPTAPASERFKALNGLVIGTTSATSVATVALAGTAKAYGANVRFAYLAQPALPVALESGAIQGYISSAPFWAYPVIRGAGVLWASGPKGEFLPELTPSVTGQLAAMREFAAANPDLIKSVQAVLADLAIAIDQRAEEAKAAVGKLYPDLDAASLDLLFASESPGWKAPPPTVEQIKHEIAVMKANNIPMPQIETVDPAGLIYP
jgi:ABC-type nitrate/sulfonate/bicarbonate transport system substrate-binding protein